MGSTFLYEELVVSIPKRRIAFVIASANRGTLIVNRFDHNGSCQASYGVGYQVLESGSFDEAEVDLACRLLGFRRKYFGDGVVAIDCGANIGVHTVEWSRQMTDWGTVTAIEAQERIFYALAGNIAINNCFNAKAIHAAVSSGCGSLTIPSLDHQKPASFGSLELTKLENTEPIGQAINYSEEQGAVVTMISLDSLSLHRCDFIKIDVEGMESLVLDGAAETITKHRPILLVEMIKSRKDVLQTRLTSLGYVVLTAGLNFLAIHSSDQTLEHLRTTTEKH
jgi:FkbM family methyltransferase